MFRVLNGMLRAVLTQEASVGGEFRFTNGPSFEDLIAQEAARMVERRGTPEDHLDPLTRLIAEEAKRKLGQREDMTMAQFREHVLGRPGSRVAGGRDGYAHDRLDGVEKIVDILDEQSAYQLGELGAQHERLGLAEEALQALVSDVAALQGAGNADDPRGKRCWEILSGAGPYVAIQPYTNPLAKVFPVKIERDDLHGCEAYEERERMEHAWVLRDAKGTYHVRPLEALTFKEPAPKWYSPRHLLLLPLRSPRTCFLAVLVVSALLTLAAWKLT